MTPRQKTQLEDILIAAHHDHARGLGKHAMFKVGNRVTSKELVQDTFIKTWRYLLVNGKVTLMKGFLYKVLNNLIIDQYRKRKITSIEFFYEKGFDFPVDETERAIDQFDGKSALKLLDHLPPLYQQVMRMKFIQELTLKEIALLTGETRNTISVRTHRGIGKLRLLYAQTPKVVV